MNAAAEAFSIRHVCGFGSDLPKAWPRSTTPSCGNPPTTRAVIQDGRKAALISFDVDLGRLPPGAARPSQPDRRRSRNVARKRRAAGRNHPVGVLADVVCRPRLVAGGLAAVGRNAGAAPSVRRGGAGTTDQRAGLRHADCAGATGAAAGRDSTSLRGLPSLRNVVGLWRAPEQVGSSACWTAQQATLTDVYLFGEAGLFGARRIAEDGSPAPDQARAPRRAARVAGIVDRRRDPADAAGHAGIARADGAGRGLRAAAAAERLPDRRRRRATTSIRITRRGSTASTGAINITAPPSGIMAVGGYRFLAQDLQEWARRLGQGALLTALPDRLSGHRLAGRALGQCPRPRRADRTRS